MCSFDARNKGQPRPLPPKKYKGFEGPLLDAHTYGIRLAAPEPVARPPASLKGGMESGPVADRPVPVLGHIAERMGHVVIRNAVGYSCTRDPRVQA